ncbi:MAG: alpha/beta fold hydrolase [Planctomycetaceae bacterium]
MIGKPSMEEKQGPSITETTPDDSQPRAGSQPRRWFLRIGVGYLGICLVLTLLQRKLIYVPTQEEVISPRAYALPADRIESLSFLSEEGVEIKGWRVTAPKNIQNAVPASERRAVIAFHGNGHHRGGRGYLFDLFNDLDCDVFIFDYPGYGETAGSPSETPIHANAAQIWELVTSEQDYQPGNIVIFGESLGGGVATQLAARLSEAGDPPAGLILRSTFSSLVDAARSHYPWLPVSLLLSDRYESIEVIPQVTCPLLIIHGTADRIVPYELGKKLFDAAPTKSTSGTPKQMLTLERGDHNNVSHRVDSPLGVVVKAFLTELKSY